MNLNRCQRVQPGMTQHLREVRKNIQNRWSAGSPPGALGEVGPEGQHLLSSSAQDTPPDCGAGSPVPAPRHGQHHHAAAAFPPSNAQLQRVIADALLREQQQQQSKVLSTTTSATNLHQPRQTTSTSSYSVTAPPARQETIC